MALRKCRITLVHLMLLPTFAVILCFVSFLSHDRFVLSVGNQSWGIVNCNGQLQIKVMHCKSRTGYHHLGGMWAGDVRGNWENDGVVLRRVGFPAFGWHHGGVSWVGSSFGTPPPRFAFTYSTFTVSYLIIAGITLLALFTAIYRTRRVKSRVARAA